MRKVPKWLQVAIIPISVFMLWQLDKLADNLVWLLKNSVNTTGTQGSIPNGIFWALAIFLLVVGTFIYTRMRNIPNS